VPPTPRKIAQLLSHQHNLLRELVEAEKVPDGQFIRRWNWWLQLVETFNELVDGNFKPEELHHYVMTLRKRPLGRIPRWEPMGDGVARMPGAVYKRLSEEERARLVASYLTLAKRVEVGSDSILVNGKLRRELAKMFAAATGHAIDDRTLVAALIDLRKDDLLPKMPAARKRGKGFSDFDEASGM
jgi:hypothetical protein